MHKALGSIASNTHTQVEHRKEMERDGVQGRLSCSVYFKFYTLFYLALSLGHFDWKPFLLKKVKYKDLFKIS
jgi:hypothetical protein